MYNISTLSCINTYLYLHMSTQPTKQQLTKLNNFVPTIQDIQKAKDFIEKHRLGLVNELDVLHFVSENDPDIEWTVSPATKVNHQSVFITDTNLQYYLGGWDGRQSRQINLAD